LPMRVQDSRLCMRLQCITLPLLRFPYASSAGVLYISDALA
jgi:hypothetical protein